MKFIPIQIPGDKIIHLRVDQVLCVSGRPDGLGGFTFAKIELISGDSIETIMSVKSVLMALKSQE